MDNGQQQTISLIRRLQQGDETAREALIAAYQGYIIKIARGYTWGNEDITHTDAYSTALIAFNEAAEKFRPERGASFSSFASQVINRRLIDLTRSEARHKSEISTENIPDIPAPAEIEKETEDLAEDIVQFESHLKRFNITLEDLVRQTPKHKDTRCKALTMARYITSNPSLLADLHNKRALPFKKLLFHFRCNPKTIQRHRKYIIAACIALMGSSHHLRDYVTRIAKGCDENDS